MRRPSRAIRSQAIRGIGHRPNELARDPSHRRERSLEHSRRLGELALELRVPGVEFSLERLDLVGQVGIDRARLAFLGPRAQRLPTRASRAVVRRATWRPWSRRSLRECRRAGPQSLRGARAAAIDRATRRRWRDRASRERRGRGPRDRRPRPGIRTPRPSRARATPGDRAPRRLQVASSPDPQVARAAHATGGLDVSIEVGERLVPAIVDLGHAAVEELRREPRLRRCRRARRRVLDRLRLGGAITNALSGRRRSRRSRSREPAKDGLDRVVDGERIARPVFGFARDHLQDEVFEVGRDVGNSARSA